jgi:hypothetical protein
MGMYGHIQALTGEFVFRASGDERGWWATCCAKLGAEVERKDTGVCVCVCVCVRERERERERVPIPGSSFRTLATLQSQQLRQTQQ